jgi:hypothetical protein
VQIAIVSGLAGIFGLFCMLLSMIQGVYKLPGEQVIPGSEQQEVPTASAGNSKCLGGGAEDRFRSVDVVSNIAV